MPGRSGRSCGKILFGVTVIFWQRPEVLILKPWKDISRGRGWRSLGIQKRKEGDTKMRMYRGRIHPHPTIVGWGVLLLLDKIRPQFSATSKGLTNIK